MSLVYCLNVSSFLFGHLEQKVHSVVFLLSFCYWNIPQVAELMSCILCSTIHIFTKLHSLSLLSKA